MLTLRPEISGSNSPLARNLPLSCLPLSPRLLNRNFKYRKIRVVAQNSLEPLQSRSDEDSFRAKPPPHHTAEPPQVPGAPARLLSDALIAANVVIFVLQMANVDVTLLGIKDNDLINQGEVWRFVTPAFLHGSPSHLAINMLSLHSLGPITEWTCGRKRFMAIYMLAAVAGNVASYFGDGTDSLGASGAIFGLAGALAVYFWRNRQLFGSRFDSLQLRLWLVIALNLGTGLVLPQIDEWGHLGGLIGGALAAFLLGPQYEMCYIKGREGVWLIDEAPIKSMATPPRQVRKPEQH